MGNITNYKNSSLFLIKDSPILQKKTNSKQKKYILLRNFRNNIFFKNNNTTTMQYINFVYKSIISHNKTYLYSQVSKIFKKTNIINFSNTTLLLSFKRSKFFPTFSNDYKLHTYLTLSLGIFMKFFYKPKSFKKSKQLYILLMSFFKKLLVHAVVNSVTLVVKFIPKYLVEITIKTLFLKKILLN